MTTPNATPSKNRPWILITVVIALFLLLGYGVNAMMKAVSHKVVENVMERAANGKADIDIKDDGVMEVKTDKGTFSTGKEMPKEWPEDAPVYPGAKVQYSATTDQDGQSGHAVVLMTSDKADKVSAYYTEQFRTLGWTMTTAAQSAGGTMMVATKDDRGMSVMIAETDAGTTVTLGVGTK
jgi:hypothetical protein